VLDDPGTTWDDVEGLLTRRVGPEDRVDRVVPFPLMKLTTPKCPDCGGPLPGVTPGTSMRCGYCGNTVIVAAAAAPPSRVPRFGTDKPASGPDVKCPECGHLNKSHYQFCLSCGGKL
jgi:DNA-directed RNA polymerase subunit RPC12/RpoP